MIKKILGSILVASALFLTACGYTAEEQKFYDACVKVEYNELKKITEFKNAIGDAKDSKAACANIITATNKAYKEKGASKEDLARLWKEALNLLPKK